MPLPRLNIEVPQEGYSFTDGEAVLRAKLSAGASRMRLDQLDAPMEGQCTLMLDPVDYQYWRSFYRTLIQRGSLPFLMGLVIDGPDVEDREVRIIPGSMSTSVQGTAHVVQFGLEIRAASASAEDASLIMLYDVYGNFAELFLNKLAKLVNSDLPRSLS